ncbi:MAG TPA: hypothetical protein VI197_02350 [Polyangiaceae bacterium]
MSSARRSLFSMALMLMSSACDTGADDRGQPGEAALATGGVSSTSTRASVGGDGSESTATTGAGGTAGDTGGASSNASAVSVTSAGGTASNVATSAGGAGSGGTSGDTSATSGGGSSAGGSSAGGSSAGGSGGQDTSACDDARLEWKSGRKTNYTSYPDPGSEECIVYNGCEWAGWFAHCDDQQSEAWVAEHDIAAMFPDAGYELHDICVRSGDRTMIVTVYDTCGDSDCDGCCTENKGDADALIDLESFTNTRWGLPDGAVEWADLGPTSNNACE